MRWKGLWTKQASAESLGAVRLEAADEALRAAGAPRDVAALLIAAGYTSAPAFLRAPWGAKEANGRYESAEWRISV